MKKYTLEDVKQSASNLKNFLAEKAGKHVATNILIQELSALDYDIDSLMKAEATHQAMKEIEIKHHKTIIAELKKMGKTDWPGMYIIHDLICWMADFGFKIRYAKKDLVNNDELIDGME